MVVARKIAYNVLISTVSKILATVLALVAIGLITRYLGADGFGKYATVMAFFSFFSSLSDLGLSSIATREISRTNADEKEIMSNVFSLRLLSCFIVVALSPLIWFLPYDIEIKKGILIVAWAFLFSSAYQVLNGIFQKNLAMDKVVISELIGKVIQVLGVVLAIKLKLGFNWLIVPVLAYMIASFFMVYFWSRRYVKIKISINFSYWKSFLKESYPIGLISIVTFVYFKIDTIILSLARESSDVGIYNAAYKVIENITFFPGMLMGLIFPIMAHSIFSDNKRFLDISNKTFKVLMILVLPLVIGTQFLSEGVINLIGGIGFAESANVLRILVFSLGFIFFANFFNSVLIAGNHQKKLMYVLGLAAILNISLNYYFIGKFSYLGAAGVAVFTEFFVVAGAFYLTAKHLKYWPKIEKFFGIIGASFLMAISLAVTAQYSFFFRGFLSVLIYILFLWAFQAVKTEEITSIISKKGVKEYEALP